MRVTSTCVLFACIFDSANTQFSDSDADDLDYNSMLAMPSADVLAQLIALSQMNAASSGGKKKNKKNKKIQVHPIQALFLKIQSKIQLNYPFWPIWPILTPFLTHFWHISTNFGPVFQIWALYLIEFLIFVVPTI